jgi:hypothetical protein
MDEPNRFCDIIEYTLNVIKTNTSSPDIYQKNKNCALIDCRTAVMDTSFEKEYEFNFTIRSTAKAAFNTVTTLTTKVNIVCGAEIQTISEKNLTYIFA